MPDFSYLDLPKAGEAQRPPYDAKSSTIRELAYGLVRVLDDEGNAVGPWNPKLDAAAPKGGTAGPRYGEKALSMTRI